MEKSNIGRKLNLFRKNNNLCDVTLVVENEKFPCHRVVLASRCSYFRTMLTNFMERNSDEVTLEGLSINGFEDLLNFIYENEVNINKDNFKDLLIASDRLGIEALQKSCEEFVEDGNELSTLVDLFMFADSQNNAQLLKKLKRFMCEKFSYICDSGSMVNLSYDGLKSILKSKFLTARKEETVFDGVFKWIRFDKESRLNYMEELLSLIKVPNLTSPYMTDLLLNEPLYDDKKYRDMVVKRSVASSYKTYKKPKLETLEPRFMLFNRSSLDDTNITGEIFGKYRFVDNFDELSFETSYLRSVLLEKNLLFVLSKDEANKLKFQRINLNTRESMELKAPPGKPRYYTLQTDGSRIYLYAQSSMFNPITKFLAYDIQLDIWIKIPDLEIDGCCIANACFTVHESKLYSIGGSTETSDHITNVYSFDTRGCYWTPLPAMNQARRRAGACIVNENLCVSGGVVSFANSMVETLDFSQCRWRTLNCSSPSRRSTLSMFSANNKLYSINGDYEKFRYLRDATINYGDISNLVLGKSYSWSTEIWRSVNIDRELLVDALLLDT